MDIFEQVKKILCDQLDLDEEQVTEDSEVIDDLGADSLDIVDLVMTLEEEFDTEIPDEDIENLRTVGDIVKYIEERSAEIITSSGEIPQKTCVLGPVFPVLFSMPKMGHIPSVSAIPSLCLKSSCFPF